MTADLSDRGESSALVLNAARQEGSLENRPWCTLLPLVIEHVGSLLERSGGLSDLLRARLACKHWHACLSRCVTRLTLRASTLRPPPTDHAPPALPAGAFPAPEAPRTALHPELIPRLAPSLRHATLRGPHCDLAALPAITARLPSLTCLSLQPGRYTASSSFSASATAEGANVRCGSSPPTASPPRLERLWISLREDLPHDALHQLLMRLLQPAAPSAPSAPVGTPPLQPPPLPLRELGLLPQLGCGLAAGVYRQRQRPPSLDVSPLLDLRLAGVTRLVLPAISPPPQQPPPSAVAAGQQQHGGPVGQVGGPPPGGSAATAAGAAPLGIELVVRRLTQLLSLTVMAQVELAALFPACLAPLTRLQALHLPLGVYCDSAADLRRLTSLSALTALELNFESEWWIDAADLGVLSRLARLRHLRIAVDYGLADDGDALSTDDLVYEQWYDNGDDADGDGDDAGDGGDGLDASQPPPPAAAAAPAGPVDELAAVDTTAAPPSGDGGRCRVYDTLEGLADALASAWARTRGPDRDSLRAGRTDPGVGDDWRLPLTSLTQLSRLEMQLGNGGGRHLAEAMHAAAPWLTAPPGGITSGGAAAAYASADGSSGGGGGASLELRDAPAAAFLDVPYWSKAATAAVTTAMAAAAGSTAVAEAPERREDRYTPSALGGRGGNLVNVIATSAVAMAPQQTMPAAPPLPRRGWQAPPLVSLTLGSGRVLCLSYPHILCLGLMTDLRSLDLSFEVAAPPPHDVAADANPLLVLSRLRRLRDLQLRIKQPKLPPEAAWAGGEAAGSRRSSGSADGDDGVRQTASPLAPMDDDVVQAWMEGLPCLEVMALRGSGRLGERALAAVGAHGALRSLQLRLKVPLPQPAAVPLDRQDGCGGSGGGGVSDDGAWLQVGYGSYYWVQAAARAGGAGGAGDGAGGSMYGSMFGSSAATPLGVSPQAPGGGFGSYMAAVAAAGATRGSVVLNNGTTLTQGSVPVRVPQAGGSEAGFSVGSDGAAAGRVECPGSVAASHPGRSGAWRELLLAEGVRAAVELLEGVPYFVRPHHLPPSLASLDLTNAAFSAEWATANTAGDGDDGGASANANAAGDGRSHSEVQPLPRLVSLRLARRPPKRRRMLERAATASREAAAAATATGDGASGGSGAPGGSSPSGPSAPSPDPTRLTDWHVVHLAARHFPTLAHLELYDTYDGSCGGYGTTGGGGGARDAEGKLHHRAVSQLGRLSYLETLTLQVGNRLRWRAQEALFASLPGGLRSLRLHAAHVYAEALRMATRLSHLTTLQVVGYTEPEYVPELEAAAAQVGSALPGCGVLVWPREVDASAAAAVLLPAD